MMVRGKDWNHNHKNKLGYHRQNQPFNDAGVLIPTLVLEEAVLIYIIFKRVPQMQSVRTPTARKGLHARAVHRGRQ
jgi:hypothetical protein